MPDNFISFRRFTNLSSNIADHGFTAEEVKLQRGSPDRNPAASPLALPRLSALRLFLKPRGSDQLRLGEPDEPSIDPFEGAPSALSVVRSAVNKLSSGILPDLQQAVQANLGGDPKIGALMSFSIEKVDAMLTSVVDRYNMTQDIRARQVGSRG